MARHQDMYLRIPPRASGQTVERLPGIGPLPGDADTFLFGPDRDEHPAVDPVFGLRIAQIGHLEERMPLPLQGDGRPLGAAADGPVTAIEFFPGYTDSGHPVACAAALATLDIYQREQLFQQALNL